MDASRQLDDFLAEAGRQYWAAKATASWPPGSYVVVTETGIYNAATWEAARALLKNYDGLYLRVRVDSEDEPMRV